MPSSLIPWGVESEIQRKRAWRAFCCSECRCVFRLEVSEETTGAICPSCSYLLQISLEGDEHAGAQEQRFETHSKATTDFYRDKQDPEMAWKEQSLDNSSHKWIYTAMAAGILSCSAIGLFGLAKIRNQGNYKKALAEADKQKQLVIEKHLSASKGSAEDAKLLEEFAQTKMSVEEIVKKADVVVKQYFAADSVEEKMKYLRKTPKLKERLEALAATDKSPNDELLSVNSGEIVFDGKFVSSVLRTKNMGDRSIVFEMKGRELLIDWESWTEWSSMPWEQFLKEKPTAPQEFRVYLEDATYFNFDFSDDTKWRCLSLKSGNGEHVIYGYVPVGSLLESQVADNQISGNKGSITLELKFLENAQSSNQVLIEKFIKKGWTGSD